MRPLIALVLLLFSLAAGGTGDALGAPGRGPIQPEAPSEPPARKSPAPVAAPSSRTYSVAAMGDSLTSFRSHGGKYLEFLQAKCPKSRFDSWGKGGNMVSQMRKRFARDVLGESKPHYTHVIILGGIADIGSNETAGRTIAKIKKDLLKMYELSHERGIEVIALTLPPWGGFSMYNAERHRMTLELNEWIRSKPKNVSRAIDTYSLLSCGDPAKLCEAYGWTDKLHWSKKGHDVIGEELYEKVFSDCE